jgi:hypothetical protein
MNEKTEFLEKEYLEHLEYLKYLNDLHENGTTNMFGARPYLINEFPYLTEQKAAKILTYWMKTFGERHEEAAQ